MNSDWGWLHDERKGRLDKNNDIRVASIWPKSGDGKENYSLRGISIATSSNVSLHSQSKRSRLSYKRWSSHIDDVITSGDC